MTENLRYGATTAGAINTDLNNSANITADNTNNPASGFSVATIDNATSGFTTWQDVYTTPRINIYQANTQNQYDSTYNTTKYGVLYNYCAATGGTACTDSSTAPTVSGSICPKGWTLPTYSTSSYSAGTGTTDGSSKDYMNLRSLYSIASSAAAYQRIVSSPLNFVRAGYIYSTSISDRSASGVGYYWSSTPNGGSYAYYLLFSSSNVNRSRNYRYSGRSIRCVAS